MTNAKMASAPKTHHLWRALVAGALGTLALLLVSASIMLAWTDRTLTDTNTYVATVGPVLRTPALQNYVADQVSSQVLASQPVSDLYAQLGGPDQAAGADAQQQFVKTAVHGGVIQVMASPQLQDAWMSVNRQAHAALIAGLNSNSARIAIDLTPFEDAVLAALKQSKLAPIAGQLDRTASQKAVVVLDGAPLERVHRAYTWLRAAPWLVAGAALVLAGLSVWVSVRHGKTLRRMLVETGVSSLLVAGLVQVSGNVRVPGSTPQAVQVASALTHVLLHGLEMALVWIGVVSLVGAAASKWYGHKHPGSAWA